MQMTCWGVRGSIPAPAPETQRYGGNTSCVAVETDDQILIVDAGTGIRPLGRALRGTDKTIYIALTHVHSDHVEGFPFFGPLYEQDRPIYLVDHVLDGTRWSLLDRLDGFHFPLEPAALPADVRRVEADAVSYLNDRGFSLSRRRVNHPGGAYGYRFSLDARTVVHIPDNEIAPPEGGVAPFDALAGFCAGADVLVHDAQYRADDVPEKAGWGHSVLPDACRLARAAAVNRLVLFHHDPDRSDEALDAMEARARDRLSPHGIECVAAHEGLTL